MIEVDVNPTTVERAYGYMLSLKERQGRYKRQDLVDREVWRARNLFVNCEPKLMKFLDMGLEIMRKENDAQADRFEEGKMQERRNAFGEIEECIRVSFTKQEFSEFSQWKQAFIAADSKDSDHRRRMFELFKYVYAGVAMMVHGPI
jgi:hypothetical protein